jgi:hypothetical protein
MDQHRVSPEDYRRAVLAYHAHPVVTALALVGIFVASFFLTSIALLSSVAAAVPSVFLIWRWILAGKQIDSWGCPKCGNSFPKKRYWTYPPKLCPHCRERPNQ